MTGSAVGQLDPFFCQHSRDRWIMIRIIRGIVFGATPVTVETPAHVHHLRILRHRDLGHIAMTSFTIQTSSNMWPVNKMHKVWHLRDRHPLNRFILFDVIQELGEFRALT